MPAFAQGKTRMCLVDCVFRQVFCAAAGVFAYVKGAGSRMFPQESGGRACPGRGRVCIRGRRASQRGVLVCFCGRRASLLGRTISPPKFCGTRRERGKPAGGANLFEDAEPAVEDSERLLAVEVFSAPGKEALSGSCAGCLRRVAGKEKPRRASRRGSFMSCWSAATPGRSGPPFRRSVTGGCGSPRSRRCG